MLKSRLATFAAWILTLGGYVQQRYLDLFNETEWWGAYEPELWGFWAYLLCVIPMGHLSERIPARSLWRWVPKQWLRRLIRIKRKLL